MAAQVLIVEDDQEIRETLRMALEDEGYGVAEASDGLVALESLRTSQTPLVVLLDFGLPHLDGPGLLRVVASDRSLLSRHRYFGVTARSTSRDADLLALCAALGVQIIPKPFELDELLATVAQAVRRLAQHSDGAHPSH